MLKADEPGFGHIDLRGLRFLALVLEMRNVSRAGAAMGLSQPAASRLLAQLRRVLGDDPLLVRASSGRYVPTARATELAPRLAEAVLITERLFERDDFDPSTARRTIRLATTDYGAAVVVAPLARELAAAAPGLSLDIRSWCSQTLRQLEDGQLDVALYADADLPPGYRHRDLFDERYCCIVRADHPVLAGRCANGRVDPVKLALLPRAVALYPDGGELDADDVLAPYGAPRAGLFRTPYFISGPLLVGGSDYVFCLPRRIAELTAGMAQVAIIDLPEVKGFIYRLIWHNRSDHDPASVWLRDRLAAVAR